MFFDDETLTKERVDARFGHAECVQVRDDVSSESFQMRDGI